jgi:1-deoxy-D-xylulose-5-phosphate synthase
MARGGALPVVAVYSSFMQRAYDPILHDICAQNLHVVFAVDRAGLVGADGETHQGLFDIAFLSHMPNMAVLSPKNRYELSAMLEYAVYTHQGPIAIRYPRAAASRVCREHNTPIAYGKAETITEGTYVAIVSVGGMMDSAYAAYTALVNDGHNPGLYNARFIKPADGALMERLRGYAHVFVLEEHIRTGGFGERVCVDLHGSGAAVHGFSFPDAFIPHGGREELLARYGMDDAGIIKRMRGILSHAP